MRYKSIAPLEDTDDFSDVEFYGFRGDIGKNKERCKEEMEIDIDGQKEITDTYSNDTQEWEEEKMKYGD